MSKQPKRWVRVKALTKEEKAEMAAVCGRFITDVLKPRFLPEVHPTAFNYPVDIVGKWRGRQYSFITRYRSGFPETLGQEFNAPFARLDHDEEHIAEPRFDVMWHRHTGEWRCLRSSVTLEEALRLIEDDDLLRPVL